MSTLEKASQERIPVGHILRNQNNANRGKVFPLSDATEEKPEAKVCAVVQNVQYVQ